MTTIKVSVRNLVEFVLKQGDLQPGSIGTSRSQEAIKAHQYIQKTSGVEYMPEVTLRYVYTSQKVQLSGEDFELEIMRRIPIVSVKQSRVSGQSLFLTNKYFIIG